MLRFPCQTYIISGGTLFSGAMALSVQLILKTFYCRYFIRIQHQLDHVVIISLNCYNQCKEARGQKYTSSCMDEKGNFNLGLYVK